MPEPSEHASQRQRRANWVGLRTLRQRPKTVGAMDDGEPIYEVRNVRLVLRPQSAYFSRLVACERCGRDQAGAPVLTAADLDVPARSVICTDCVRKAGVSSVWESDAAKPGPDRPVVRAPRASAAGEPPVPPAPAVATDKAKAAPATSPPPPRADDGRLAAMEAQLATVGARVEELARLAREERRVDQTAEAAAAVRLALADTRTEMAAAAEAAVSRVAAVEASVRQSLAGLAQLIDGQRVDLSAVVQATAQARDEVQRAVEEQAVSSRRTSAAVEELSALRAVVEQHGGSSASGAAVTAVVQRLDEVAAQVAHAATRLDALAASQEERDRRLLAVEQRVERLSTPHTGEAPAAPGQGEGVQLLEALEQQLRGASTRLAALSTMPGEERQEERQ